MVAKVVLERDDEIPGMGPISDDVPSLDEEPTRGARARKATSGRRRRTSPEDSAPGLTLPNPGRTTDLAKSLEKMYATIAIGLAPFDMICAQEVAANAPTCARAWDELAKQNDAVRRILEGLVKTGAWGGVLAAHAPLMVAVVLHHGSDEMKGVFGSMANMQARANAASGTHAA